MVTIKVTPNGPYLVEGDEIKLIDWTGHEYPVPNRRSFALCRCGGSRNKPLCDGTHSRSGFKADQPAPESRDHSAL